MSEATGVHIALQQTKPLHTHPPLDLTGVVHLAWACPSTLRNSAPQAHPSPLPALPPPPSPTHTTHNPHNPHNPHTPWEPHPDGALGVNVAAQPYHSVVNGAVFDRAAVADDGVLDVAVLQLGGGQEARGGVDGGLGVVELKGRLLHSAHNQ
jgi:hypothetical protein